MNENNKNKTFNNMLINRNDIKQKYIRFKNCEAL